MAGSGPADWLAAHAGRRPAAPAFSDAEGRSWSYAALRAAVDHWAGWLYATGVRPGMVICVAAADPVPARLLRLALGRLGAVDALVDPALPDRDIADRVRRTRATRLLTDRDVAGQGLPMPGRPASSTAPPLAVGQPGPPARVLFTTGSSGEPKAVLQRGGHLASAARANAQGRELLATDSLACLLPAHHAAGALFEDTMLYLGGALHLPPPRRAGWLADTLAGGGATVASMVPAMLAELADQDQLGLLAGLRVLNYAGEAIATDLLRRVVAAFPGQLTRGYGLTEAGPLVSILPDADHRRAVLPDPGDIGRPAPGVEVRIAGDPAGGELLVRSGHVMSGYLHDPAATRARLRDGWLATGDIAQWHPGGLRLLGRRGNRIRSGGEWVSLEQVEGCLCGAPHVREAVAVAVAHPRWSERPVAYVRVAAGFRPADFWRHVDAALNRYARPDWVAIVDELPRLRDGKVDRATVARWARRGPATGVLRRPPPGAPPPDWTATGPPVDGG